MRDGPRLWHFSTVDAVLPALSCDSHFGGKVCRIPCRLLLLEKRKRSWEGNEKKIRLIAE